MSQEEFYEGKEITTEDIKRAMAVKQFARSLIEQDKAKKESEDV